MIPFKCRSSLAALLLGASLSVLPGVSEAAAEKPNIILIFVDDLGWTEVGYQGSDFHETPNLDRLAGEGMVFSAAYAGASNCAPSRACLLSGQYSPRHEVYAVGSTERGDRKLMRMKPVPNRRSLAPENVTMAGALKAAGYVTGVFGKWHLEAGPGTKPAEQGFDVVYQSGPGGWRSAAEETDNPKGIFSLTRGVEAFMESNRDRPFFAYLSHHAPHTPYEARPATLARFKAKQPGTMHHHALYAAMIYDLDDGIGQLMRKVEDLGLDRKTLVVFTSDNGSNFPVEMLRGKKGSYYEAGTYVPFFVRWPGVVRPGTRSAVPIINQDLYPTFLAAAGAAAPAGKVLDGESLLPLFRETGSLRRQAIFWHFPGYLNGPVPRGRDTDFRTRPVSAIHKGDWKLHLFHEEWQLDGGRSRSATNNAVELYNLKDDLAERRNLAGSHPGKRDELLDDLLAWFKSSGARLPTERNPAYAP